MEGAAKSVFDNITQVGEGVQVLINKIKLLEDKLKQSEKDKELLLWSNSQLQKKLGDFEIKQSILLRKNQHLTSRISRDKMENTNVPDLPIEMWEKVFDKVEDSQSWFNLYHASSSFQVLLREKRTSALLPEVLQLLLQQELISISDILCCRLVNSDWKVKATKAFKNHLKSEEDLDKFVNNDCSGRVELHDITSIQCFLQDMRNNQGNPFVGRNVSLRSEFLFENESTEEFWGLGISFLEKFGKHIDNFEFACLPAEIGIIKLKECLQLIPQITGLHIVEDGDLPEEDVLQNLSLPALNNLERLILIEISIPNMRKIFQEVCSAPEGLKQLDICKWDGLIVSEILPRFPNLEIILLHMKPLDLEHFRGLSFPLRKLSVYQELEKDGGCFMEAVFTSCLSFSDTLVHLYIEYQSFHGKANFLIHLPQLKKLEFELSGPFSVMSNSETFIFPHPASYLLKREKVTFEQVEERCIWKLIPNLDTFIDHGTYYGRPKESIPE